MKFDGF